MSESSINVCVRIRPFSDKEAAQLAPNEDVTPFLGDGGLGASPNKPFAGSSTSTLRTRFIRPIVRPMDQKVLVFDPPDNNPLTRLYNGNHLAHGSKRSKDVRYAFDRIFDSTATQNDVFEETCKPLLDGILNGYNASVFAYGATGCGKTHTISGTPQDPGLIFLTMKELYNRIQDARDESDVYVRLSYLEIYNETIRDLLSAEPTPPGAGLALREDANNRISVVGITELVPESPESVLEYIQEGNARRTMSPTEANAVSSRSHAVLQINVTQKPRTASMTEQTTSASLNIIDLAGSERASATRNNGARMKEGANINKSLLALGNCINALCQSGGVAKHVPYRNSKLTRLLKFSLGGNCKTVMVVCISPSSVHYEETHNALKYANQAKNIRTKVSRNMINVDRHVAQYVQAIHELKEENERLKARLEERGSLETAAEKRKRAEMGREVEEAKKRMRESTDNVTRLVSEKAIFEAQTSAAETRLAELKKRFSQIENELSSFAKAGEVLPSDLEGERDVLRGLMDKEEKLLAKEEMQAGVRSLLNSLQMQRGIIVAASHNQKFDSEAAENVRTLGNAMLAEVESAKTKAKLEGLLDILKQNTSGLTGLITVAARSTVALREVAGELEYRASNSKTESVEEMASTLSLLASQLRSISGENDKVFENISGATLPINSAAATKPAVARPAKTMSAAAVRRSRTSLAVSQTATAAAPLNLPLNRSASSAHLNRASSAARRASMAPPMARSVSLQIASSPITDASGKAVSSASTSSSRPSFAAPTSASSAKSLLASSSSPARKGPVRRVSTAASRRMSSARSSRSTASSHPISAAPTLAPVEEKKKFRWADEAGEGDLDDKGEGAANAMSPAEAIESSPEQLAVRKAASRVTFATPANEVDDGSPGNSSGAEWEDMSDGRSTPAGSTSIGGSVASKPLPRSTSLGAAKASSSGGLFDRGSLSAKRSVSTESGLPALHEDEDVETGDQGQALSAPPVKPMPATAVAATANEGAGRQPFRALNIPQSGLNAATFNASLPPNITFAPGGTSFDINQGSLPSKPFPRPSAGGPGPMRRKVRASLAVATPFSAPSRKEAVIPGQSGSSNMNRVKASRVSIAPPARV